MKRFLLDIGIDIGVMGLAVGATILWGETPAWVSYILGLILGACFGEVWTLYFLSRNR